jgi:hypothetical protein
MICPFCHHPLLESLCYKPPKFNKIKNKSLYCNAENCLIEGDMPRYSIYLNDDSEMVNETYYIKPYYVQASCEENLTIVSVLNVIVLLDSVVIPRCLNLNFDDINFTLEKIKVLMTFS